MNGATGSGRSPGRGPSLLVIAMSLGLAGCWTGIAVIDRMLPDEAIAARSEALANAGLLAAQPAPDMAEPSAPQRPKIQRAATERAPAQPAAAERVADEASVAQPAVPDAAPQRVATLPDRRDLSILPAAPKEPAIRAAAPLPFVRVDRLPSVRTLGKDLGRADLPPHARHAAGRLSAHAPDPHPALAHALAAAPAGDHSVPAPMPEPFRRAEKDDALAPRIAFARVDVTAPVAYAAAGPSVPVVAPAVSAPTASGNGMATPAPENPAAMSVRPRPRPADFASSYLARSPSDGGPVVAYDAVPEAVGETKRQILVVGIFTTPSARWILSRDHDGMLRTLTEGSVVGAFRIASIDADAVRVLHSGQAHVLLIGDRTDSRAE